MKQRYDASWLKLIDSKDTSHFVKIGVAFQEENGQINIILDTLPIGDWNGRITHFFQRKMQNE